MHIILILHFKLRLTVLRKKHMEFLEKQNYVLFFIVFVLCYLDVCITQMNKSYRENNANIKHNK